MFHKLSSATTLRRIISDLCDLVITTTTPRILSCSPRRRSSLERDSRLVGFFVGSSEWYLSSRRASNAFARSSSSFACVDCRGTRRPRRDKNPTTTRGRFVWSAWTGQHSVEDIITETRWSLELVGFVVGVFVLVALHVARLVRQVLSASDSSAFTTLVETLLVRACVLADVRQSVHCGGRFPSLKQNILVTIIVKQNKTCSVTEFS